MRATFLGTGTSHGIPVIACDCPVCSLADPRDERYRASLLVEYKSTSILIDSGPEFRLQALRAGIKRLDAVLVTHAHADHLHGLDDIRPLSVEHPLPVYSLPSAIAEIRERFSYAFSDSQPGGGKPRIDLLGIEDGERVMIGDLEVEAIGIDHGKLPILGFRIDAPRGAGKAREGDAPRGEDAIHGDASGIAYLTDCSHIPEAAFARLRNLDAFVIGALRERPHTTHFTVPEAIEAARRVGAKRGFLTHLCHETSHRRASELCGAASTPRHSIEPAVDGLRLEIPVNMKEGS